MATMLLDFVSQDKMVFSGQITSLLAPGSEGQLGILPRHSPLMTVLAPGEVIVHRENEADLHFAISGGWMEVRPDKATILARTAERPDEINLERARAARDRAERLLREGAPREDRPGIRLALQRSRVRIKVGHRRAPRPGMPAQPEEFGENGR
jgi:F-type H+-transporting ATPase subunit epsilon